MSATLFSILSLGFLLLCLSAIIAVFGYYFHVVRRTIRYLRRLKKRYL